MANGNGKWQLAFWIISVIASIGLITLTQAVVANDRIRACEDQRLEARFSSKYDSINEKLTCIREDMSLIKAKLEIE